MAGFDSVLQTLQSFSFWAFPLPLHRDGLPEYLAEKKKNYKIIENSRTIIPK